MVEEDFASYLTTQGRSSVSAFHEFRLSVSQALDQVHLFFEGLEDRLFYLSEIRRRCENREINPYICGGKWGVLGVRKLILDGGYNLDTCHFFVDRDFDDFFDRQPAPDEAVYITDYYSIENELVNVAVMDVVLLDFAGMSKADPAYEQFLTLWDSAYNQFARAIRPLMAWGIAMRHAGKKPNLNNVDLRRVITCVDGRWRRAPAGFVEFSKACARKDEFVPLSDVRRWLKALQSGAEKRWIRGKYELWFFETYLLVCLSPEGVKKKRWTIPRALKEKNLFEVLGGRISPPLSLVEFLDGRLGAKA